jgi:methyltransferase (TIGR00027 family)
VDASAVDRTAIAVAACRAIEATRPDALVRDPFAAELVGASGMGDAFPTRWPDDPSDAGPFDEPILLGSAYIGMRTRFIDDALAARPIDQTVILGAGLDTRSYRLQWPPTARVFEVDRLETLLFKRAVLGKSASGRDVLVPADISGDWSEGLVSAGLDTAEPTAWVIEGLLPYLASRAQRSLLDSVIALSGPGSWAVIERAVPIPATGEADDRLNEISERTGVPMSDLLARADPPDPVEVLGDAGWASEGTSVAQLEKRFGRRLRPDGSAVPAHAEPSRAGFVVVTAP